jgi:prevent-host-death family protein
MQEVGVRELKNQATEILREVREQQAEYIVTYRGKPVAVILPLNKMDDHDLRTREAQASEPTEDQWAALDWLRQEIDKHWQSDKSALETLLEMRRERDESLAHPGASLEQMQMSGESRENSWAEWNDLREEIGKSWYTGRTAVEAVAEQRE